MTDSAAGQRSTLTEQAEAHVIDMKQHIADGWLQAIAEVHTQVLQDIGFVDLDPGSCFQSDPLRTFARCCSVGDYAPECWAQDDGPSETRSAMAHANTAEQMRCCGPAPFESELPPRLVASVAAQLGSSSPRRPKPEALIPLVSAWLADPRGRDEREGVSRSGMLVEILAEDIEQDELIRNTLRQLEAPIDNLQAQLRALGPEASGHLIPGVQDWLPAPPLASSGGRRVLHTTVALAPGLEQAEIIQHTGIGPVEEIPLRDLPHKFAAGDGISLVYGSAGLREAAALLRQLANAAEDGGQVAASKHTEATDFGEASNAINERDCKADGWRELHPEKAKVVGFGHQVRIRQRMSEDVTGEEAVVQKLLSLVGEPGETVLVWEVKARDGTLHYVDFADPAVAVAVPCGQPGGTADSLADLTRSLWPACIEANVGSPSSSGNGLFVNLEALGIREGCFQGDCGHSDHFAAEEPGECARACARIGACRWWTFREAGPAPTCWLRGGETSPSAEEPGAASGRQSCVPPAGPAPAASLFELVGGPAKTPPPSLWEQWDLVEVLERFGHLTPAELRRSRPSVLQQSALRAVAIASSRCAQDWRGCLPDARSLEADV